MIPSSDCFDIIKKWEGLVDGDPDTPGLEPYVCPAGVPTIGWGSTWDFDGNAITMQHRAITMPEAQELLEQEVSHCEVAVSRLIQAEMTQGMYDAIISFCYNVGSGNLQASTLRRKLNRGNYLGAADEFPKWRMARGQILLGLVLRRAEECRLFLGE